MIQTEILLCLKKNIKNTPKKGSAFYFDGDRYHAGNSPVESTYRTVVNFDFRIND